MLVVAINDNNVSYGNLHIPNNIIWNYFVSLMNTKTHKLFSHKMLKLLCLFLVPLCLFICSEQIQRRQLIVIHGIITVVSFLTTRRGRMDWAAVVPFSCTQNTAEVVFFPTTIVRSYRWRPSSGRYLCFFCDGRDLLRRQRCLAVFSLRFRRPVWGVSCTLKRLGAFSPSQRFSHYCRSLHYD